MQKKVIVGRKRKKPFIEKAVIEDIAAEGKAIAKYNDCVVFVPYVIPGDIVDLQVTKKRKRYMEARVERIHELSKDRIEAFCEHYGVCGGCKWQILPYELQLKHKHKQVEDALRRIGKVELPEFNPILGSEKTKYYRNKLEFTFSCNRWLAKEEMGQDNLDMDALGFHIPKLFDKIIDVKHCFLQDEPSNLIRLEIKRFAKENDFSFYNQRTNEGLLRNVIVRTSTTGQVMLIVVFGEDVKHKIDLMMNHLDIAFGDKITALLYVVNQKMNDTIGDQEIITFKGLSEIYEEMEGLKFKIGPKSFYQTNSEQAYNLYSIVRDFAELNGSELVYDLYTGTGTIACFVAKEASKVIGVEYVEDAVVDARENAKANSITNTAFFAGDMKDVLNDEFIEENGRPDVIITDPPRAGMHASVVDTILRCSPQKIVYVSCNPATQARDLELLDSSYKVVKVQPVDMFPHTHHVENVVLLIKE